MKKLFILILAVLTILLYIAVTSLDTISHNNIVEDLDFSQKYMSLYTTEYTAQEYSAEFGSLDGSMKELCDKKYVEQKSSTYTYYGYDRYEVDSNIMRVYYIDTEGNYKVVYIVHGLFGTIKLVEER